MRLSLRTLTVLVLLATAILLVAVHRPASRARAALRPAASRAAGIQTAAAPRPAESARGTCPPIAPAKPVTSVVPGAGSSLVPGTPTVALICRFNGMPEPPGSHLPDAGDAGYTLLGQARISGAALATLASQFDALGPFPSGPLSCPLDTGASATVSFSYASGPDDVVTVGLSGCADSRNGQLTRCGAPAALDTLARGSASFVRAHEATIAGRVTGKATGLGVTVEAANGDRTAFAASLSPRRRFRVLVTPGRDTVSVSRDQPSVEVTNPGTPLATARVTVSAGKSTDVLLRVH